MTKDTELDDLLQRLKSLCVCQHDDHSVAGEAVLKLLALERCVEEYEVMLKGMATKLKRIATLCAPVQCQQFPIVREILDICLERGVENREVENYRELYRTESIKAHDAQVQRDYLIKKVEAAYAELRKQRPAITAVFDEYVWEDAFRPQWDVK